MKSDNSYQEALGKNLREVDSKENSKKKNVKIYLRHSCYCCCSPRPLPRRRRRYRPPSSFFSYRRRHYCLPAFSSATLASALSKEN